MTKRQSPKPHSKGGTQKKGRRPAEAPEVQAPAATEPPVQPESLATGETPREAAAPPEPEQPLPESTPAEATVPLEVTPEPVAPEAAAPAQTKAKKGGEGTQAQADQRPGRRRQGAGRIRRSDDHPGHDRGHGRQGLLVLPRRTDPFRYSLQRHTQGASDQGRAGPLRQNRSWEVWPAQPAVSRPPRRPRDPFRGLFSLACLDPP